MSTRECSQSCDGPAGTAGDVLPASDTGILTGSPGMEAHIRPLHFDSQKHLTCCTHVCTHAQGLIRKSDCHFNASFTHLQVVLNKLMAKAERLAAGGRNSAPASLV